MAESIENPDHAQNGEGTGAADHLCRTALCINPDYFEIISNAENARRSYRDTPRLKGQKR